MKLIIKAVGVLVVSFALVFGVIEIGTLVYEYYINKGLQRETASFLTLFGIGVSVILSALGANQLLGDNKF